ncbi:alpha/beta fold hydrolase [Tenggerimyces flavus]|uniref:Alpha/beta fold hydrolase n=1 Tax=Tenggerimyces flavus TaxID=1708749 RepID=A0ABV7YRD2_9ACTN|nr:alpha/beta hydrolase [Tenggerimyces flavus]MBM7786374.1 pimeloyl-ACP methyl ester carboxylesterase [Tenggerimyces flavus]
MIARLLATAFAALLLATLVPAAAEAAPSIHRSGYVEVDGARLFYEVKGPRHAAHRTPVILVHGLSLDHRMWDQQFGVLASTFLTYRFDLRGHGRSDPVTAPVGLHDNVVGFMDALGIDRAHLVGQSLGGNAVTEVAATRPERVAKLVLIDSGINGFAYPTPNVLQRIPTYLEIDKQQGRAAALRAWLRDPLFATSFGDPKVRPQLEKIIGGCDCSLFFNPAFQIRPPTFSRLGQVRAKTLVLIGTLDEPEFQAASTALDTFIPRSTRIDLPGAGHMSNMERPLPVTLATLFFLAS